MRWIDGHCDVLWRIWEDETKDFYHHRGGLDVTYQYLIQSQVKLQIFAVFVPPSVPQAHRYKEVIKQIHLFYQQVIGDGQRIVPIRQMAELDQLKENQCGAMLTLEGADPIGTDLTLLDELHQLGVQQIGLTWNRANAVADGILEKRGRGLTDFGRQFLQEMARLKMVVDVSHISEAGFWDVVESFSVPVVASHSNCRTICGHIRNLTDEQIKALIQKDGLIGINFVPFFVAEHEPKLTNLFDHIDHIVSLGGENHLFFGSDFDGEVDKIPGLESMKQLNNLKNELLKRYPQEMVWKWGFQNGYRFYAKNIG